MSEIEQAILILVGAVAVITSLMWLAGDVRKRKKGFAVVLLCLFTWPLGILVWLLFRPDVFTADDHVLRE
jgi:hypothetical protein